MPDIQKTILLNAPIAKVWAAVSDSRRFGAWFGAAFDGPFIAGNEVGGRIAPTQVDPEVAAMQAPHAGKALSIVVDRIEPPHLFAFRWHPFACEVDYDYSVEPMTFVTFTLAEEAGGTRLTITEDGFARIAAARREAALKANDGGWAHQARMIGAYLAMQE